MDLDDFPVIESFGGLQRGERVYSKKYGTGYIFSFYNDDVIICFSNHKKRFSVDDKEIRKIPDKYLEKPKTKVEINVDGESMSCLALKRKIKEDKQKYVTVSEAMEILNINENKFYKAIQISNIETRKFGRSLMIHRDDLLKLSKTFLK